MDTKKLKLQKPHRSVLALALGALFSLALLPSLWALLGGHWPFSEDAPALFGPWRSWAAQHLKNGVIPLWNPHSFCGMPFLANGQTAIFYPPNLLYWLLPIREAMLGDAFFHGLLLGAGGYALGRALQLRAASAFLLALCLMLGSGVAGHLYAGHFTWHASRSYLPWQLWALTMFLNHAHLPHPTPGNASRFAVWLAVFFALQAHAGYPPYVLASAAWCALWLMLWCAAQRKLPPRAALWSACSVLLLAAVLAAAYVLPLREAARLASHGVALPFERAVEPSSTVAGLVRLLFPNFFGGSQHAQWSIARFPHEEAAYIGLLPALLALGAPLFVARSSHTAHRFALFLWPLLPIAMLLALGDHTPVYRFLYDTFPPLRLFRAPARWLEVWYLAAAVLAAIGFDALFIQGREYSLKHLRALLIGAGAIALVLCALVALSSAQSSWWLESAQWTKRNIVADFAARLSYAEYLRATALQSALCAVVLAGFYLLVLRRFALTPTFPARRFLLALIACDLLLVFWSAARFFPFPDARSQWPATAQQLFQENDVRWNTALENEHLAYGLNGNLPLSIDTFGGYDALAPHRFFEVASFLEGEEVWSSQYQPTPRARESALLRVFNIGAVWSSPPHPQWPQKNIIARHGSGQGERILWRRVGAWPRVYLSRNVLRAPENSQLKLLRQMAAVGHSAVDIPVMVDSDAPQKIFGDIRPSSLLPGERVLDVRRTTNQMTLQIEAKAPSVVVIGEVSFPAWRAFVNGNPAHIETVNWMLRGVGVPAGRTQIHLVYDSATLRIGIFLSLCGLGCLSTLLVSRASSRSRARARKSPVSLN